MKVVSVKFNGQGKEYIYFTKLNLVEGADYIITADSITTYANSVTVINTKAKQPSNIKLREITSAFLVSEVETSQNSSFEIERIHVDKKHKVMVVFWKDNTKTIVRCSKEDTFNIETGISMCYMKKALGNKGNYLKRVRKLLKEDSYEKR